MTRLDPKGPAAAPAPLGAPPADKQRRLEILLIVFFWTLLGMLTVGQRTIDPRGMPGTTLAWIYHIVLEYGLWIALTPFIFWLSRRFSLDRGRWPRYVLHITVALLVAQLVNVFSIYTFVTLVLEDPERPFSLQRSLLSFRFLDELIIYLTVLAAGFARDYFLRYRARQNEMIQLHAKTAQLQAQLSEARLLSLRMQLNPHFLFNTLHAVSALVERDPQGVRRMIARLSELLRYALDGNSAQEVPLRQELDFLRRYLDIQQIRFQGHLNAEEEVAVDVLEARVPNLILQPLVENAIKHGVSQIEGVGHIAVAAWRKGERLHITVRDNGPLLSGDGAPPVEEGIGLQNTRARLEQLYGEAQSLTLTPGEDRGLVVHLTLPYHTADALRITPVTEPEKETAHER
jgi:two-component system LytT family sensor kinase